jgi:small-conductance mechanosensitive channel
MRLQDILEFTIIKTEKFSLNVYHLFIAILILISTWIILRIIRRIFHRLEKRERINVGTGHAIFQIIRYVLWISAILITLDSIGITITFLLAGSAALLVGLGLGLQQIFQDFISGIVLIIEGTLRAGDVVQMADGEVGMVKEINMRTSKIETRDNIILIVPNSKLINEVVINWSHLEKKTRFKVEVGVAYGSDVELVKKVLLECASSHKLVSSNPTPVVRFIDFSDSALMFQILFWSTSTFRIEDVKSDLRFLIDKKFRENRIRIPFPQRDVHLYPTKGNT